MSAEDKAKKPADYSDEPCYGRGKALLRGLLRWLECEFFGGFVFLSLLAMRVVMGRAADVLFGLMGLALYVMIMADLGQKEGMKARIKNNVRGDSVKRSFGWLIGFVSVMPSMLSYVMLALSYTGVVGNAVLPFKALNAGLWGLIDLFVQDMDIRALSPVIFAVYPAVQLVIAAAAGISFGIAHDNDDLESRIVYKRK